jgi:hypothetical protein
VTHQQERDERRRAHGERGQAGVGDLLDRADELVPVAARGLVDAEELGGLIDDDADREAQDEPAHHRS